MRITGVGTSVPMRRLSNTELAQEMAAQKEAIAFKLGISLNDPRLKQLETSPEWIEKNVGVCERPIANAEDATSDLATDAARAALEESGLRKDCLGFVIVGTVSPDHWYSPFTAALVAEKLGIRVRDEDGRIVRHLPGHDTGAACCSFMSALESGYARIRSGLAKAGLVIGADKMSVTVNQNDHSFWPIMGDAAGAFVVERTRRAEDWFGRRNFLSGMDGSFAHLIDAPAGGSRRPLTEADLADPLVQPHKLRMDGPRVFKQVVRLLPDAIGDALRKARVQLEEVGCIVVHQMNARIIREVDERLRERGFRGAMPVTIERFGNTTSASLPLGYAQAREEGIVNPGMLVLFVGVGGGLTWATALMRQGNF